MQSLTKGSERRNVRSAAGTTPERTQAPRARSSRRGFLNHKQEERALEEAMHVAGSGCCLLDCYVQSGVRQDNGVKVKAYCTNPDCLADGYLHEPCYEKLEANLVTSLKRGMRHCKMLADEDIRQSLWQTNRSGKYDLINGECRCRCGAGFFRCEVEASG